MRIGNRELEILTYIAENPGVGVGEIAAHFSEKHALGRTTVTKVVDRLFAKGLLDREGLPGRLRYRSRVEPDDVQAQLTRQFVNDTLNGSIAPFVAYLRSGADISEDDLKELRRLVQKLEEDK